MTTMTDVVDSAVAALCTGVAFQTTIRAYLDTTPFTSSGAKAEYLALICESFKTRSEKLVLSADTPEEGKLLRKKANNVVNDISRISRAETGHTIKCVSRKDGYKYKATEIMVKPIRVRGAIAEATSMMDKLIKANPWDELFANQPKELLKMLVQKHGGDKIGSLVVEVLKETPEVAH